MTIDQNHPNLKIFKQHGFIAQGISGSNQVIGRCPFCGSNKKFFVNPETKKWDCKVCNHNGGYQMFLEQIVRHGEENFTGEKADFLCRKRGIKLETFQRFHVGYNPVNETYLIPVWDEKQEEICNIRIYRKDGILMNSAGCKTALYNWWNLERSYKTVWICEGEWDTIAMQEILDTMHKTETVVVGVPGATTFNAKWSSYFTGRAVHIALDNDFDKTDAKGFFHAGAGKQGSIKLQKALENIARSLDFVHWLRIYPDGFDVNDLLRKKKGNALRAYNQLEAMLQPTPPEIDYPEGQEPEDVKVTKEPVFTGPGIGWQEAYDGFTKWLYLKDPTCIDITFGTVLANRLPGDPVWMFLTGPSGCGKSELIMALDDCPRIYPLSRLTNHSLISGSPSAGGNDPSLVPKLNGMLLALKDFTNVLGMMEQVRHDIFSQLRDAYDGKCANYFGTGANKSYNSKFGILAGVTEAIEIYLEGGTALGERFLSWKFPSMVSFADQCLIMQKALDNLTDGRKEEMREELRAIALRILDHDFGVQPELSDVYQRKIMAMSYLDSRMRGTVMRNKYTREIERNPYIEAPARIAIQLSKLSMGIAQFRGKAEVDDEIYEMIKATGFSTFPQHLAKILQNIWDEGADEVYTTNDISEIMRLPLETSKRFAENMSQLRILRQIRPKGGMGNTFQWKITDEILEIIQLSELFVKPKSKGVVK